MYTRRAAVFTFESLRPLLKPRRTASPGFPSSASALCFVRNLGTATERSDLQSDWDANNQAFRSGYNQDGSLYGRDAGNVHRNPRQTLNGPYSNFISENSNFVGDNTEACLNNNSGNVGDSNSSDLNRNPNRFYRQNFDVPSHNSAPAYVGNGQSNSESYGGNEDVARQTVRNPAMHQQSVAGNYYNDEFQVTNDINATEESRPRKKIEDLDEFTKEGKLKEAVQLLGDLQNEGVQVDLSRFLSLMKLCGENESLNEAKSVHEHILKSGAHMEVKIYNWILEMYSKCGSMNDAFQVFDQMPQRNLTSWDIMIFWLAKNGHGEDSIELFSEFKISGLKPDGQMFISVFSACGVVNDTIEGMLHFESMMKDYDISPTMDHYVSIVDMFGNAGCVDEALEFIEKLQIEPTIEIWETLMKFCRIHGNTELGDRCVELINLLDPSRLNDQSQAGLIPLNAADIAREKEKRKLNGLNPLDVRSRSHEYRAGDRSHPDQEKIYTLLGGLKHQMKELGYVPQTRFVLHDVDEEVKEESLMAHSERLAVAQGFLTSPARSDIRIIKNLRVCGDCHNAFKIISTIVGRVIISRDTKRFHHFKDGSCSCNDFW